MNVCPTEIELQRWLAGDLGEAESQTIETHVEGCTQICQPLIDGFSGFEDGRSVSVSLASQAGGTPAPQTEAGETPAVQPADFPKLPGYDMLGQLGRGGMGVVYKARHRRMDRLVAIKVLPPGLIDDAAVVARFEREVRAAARLHHPHIVAAYDAAEAGGVHFLVMEYVEGMDLAARVRRQGPLAVEQAVDCVLQAARGLDYAHRHGVVHRDIKPSNLLVDREGVVKVLDMGLTRFESSLGGEQTDLTSMGQIMGTVDYMAPEQALDTHRADARSDIYSLGMTLWYLLTGRPAYTGENALARLLAHREQPIPSLRSACPGATPELEAVFSKMAAKQPEDRYQTMAEVVAALEDGLPRPSSISAGQASDVGWDQRACERRPTITDTLNARPDVAVQAAPDNAVASPATEATVTLQSVEVDTDPNTEQSLDLLAGALPRPPRPPRRKLPIAAALAGLAAIAAAAFVVRVETDTGEVVIESEVDDISVDIVRNGQPVKEDWQIHAGDDNRWVVRSGIVNVRLPANLDGQFSLDQDTARLIRDGKILVKITRKKKTDVPAVAADDRDRAAAEWVLAHKGFVQFIYELDSSRPLGLAREIGELPPEPFRLYQVHLWGVKDSHGLDLSCLQGLRRLQHVNLGDTKLDADAIRPLAAIPNLRDVDLYGTRVKSSELVGLAGASKLRWLSLSAQQNDDAYEGLVQLRSLRQLVLYGASDEEIFQLGKVTQLRTLWLPDATSADEEAVAKLHAANPLCRVLVGQKKDGIRAIGPDPIAELARQLRAKGIDLDIAEFPRGGPRRVTIDADVAEGATFTIAALVVPANVSLADVDWMSRLDAPLAFRAPQAVGADHYAAALANQSLVYWVLLRDSDLTDNGLEHLKLLPSASEFDIRGTKVTAAGVEALRKALPECNILWDPPASTTAPASDRDRAAAEWVLEQGGQVQVSLDGKWTSFIGRRDDLPAGRFKLIHAVLAGVATVGDDDLDRFTNLDGLWGLHLGGTPIGRDALGRLSKLRALLSLHLGGTKIMTSELPALAALPRLESISIFAKGQVDDRWAGLRSLASVRDLNVYGASADDLRQLAELKQLRTIWLSDAPADVDEQVVAKLQAVNPLCRVLVGPKGAVRSLGRDPVAELAQRLLKKKARLEVLPFPPGSGPLLSANIEAEVAAGRPFEIRKVQFEPGTALDEEELNLLRSPSSLNWWEAYGAVGADGYAAALAGQPLLSGISLGGSDLTDAGLAHLKSLPSLSELGVRGTQVSRAAVDDLHAALPSCRIVSDYGTIEPVGGEQLPSLASSPVSAEDRERAAAEWVLAQGGTIRCWTADGKSVEAKTGAELPAGQFEIHNVNLWGCASVTSADLDRFVGLPRLTRLLVARTQVDGDAIPQIQKMPHLTHLHLTLTGVRSSDLAGLAPLRGLHLLWLDPRTQNDDAWAGLAALSGLRILLLSSNASADDIRQLGKLSQLRTVRLVDSPDVEDAVAELQAANPLCRVVVGDDSVLRAIGRDNVAELAKRLLSKGAQVGISTLDGGPAKPINDELAAGRPVFVGNITLPVGVSLDEEELRLLDALDGLRWFKADNCQGADRHAAALAKQSALVGINFNQSDLTDAGLEQLRQLPALSDLYIRGTKVTNAGVAALREALPECKLDWEPPASPTPTTTNRDRAAAEWVLAQGGKVDVIQAGKHTFVQRPADLPEGEFSIYTVVLYGLTQVKDQDLDRFAGLNAIWDLHAGETSLGPQAVPAIGRLRGLEQLKIGGTRVTSSSLSGLRDLPRLYYLSIVADRQIDDEWEGLKHLPFLRELQVFRASSGDLRRLAEVRQLRSIWLPDAVEVAPDALAELQLKNPLCRIVVGDESAKVIGDDHQRLLCERLLARGAKLRLSYRQGAGAATTLDASQRPVHLLSVTLPPGATLSDEELRLFGCLTSIEPLVAPAAVDADRWAAAFGEQASRVRNLQLANSDLTDAGLAHLAALPRLAALDVRRTRVTGDGVHAFQRRRPDCAIKWTPPRPASPSADQDRAAAEWIIASGGFVGVVPSGKRFTVAKSPEELPSGALQVAFVHLTGEQTLTNADLDRLVGLRRLEQLQVGYTNLDGGALAKLAGMPSLRDLLIDGTRVKSSDLAALKPLPKLHSIRLQAGDQIDDDYAGLDQLPQLRQLTLLNATADDVRRVAKLKRLRTLWLPDAEISERDIAAVQQANPLCRILIGDAPVRSVGKDHIAELARRLIAKEAELLIFEFPNGPGLTIKSEAELPTGKALEIRQITLLSGASLDDEEVAWLSCPCPLWQFSAVRATGADRYAASLSSQPILQTLRLTDSDLTDAGLNLLKNAASLTELDVRGTRVTRAGVDALRKALPDCKIAWQPPEAPTSAP